MSFSRFGLLTVAFLPVGLLACAADRTPLSSDEAIRWAESAESLGVDFRHRNGGTGMLYFIEPVGAGVGVLDYDGDGDYDIWLRQSGSLDGSSDADEHDRLFRNEWVPTGGLSFVDVTNSAGLHATGYGMGIAVADVDNDGDSDAFLTNFGPDQLWINQGDGRFVRTEGSDLSDNRWTTSASFFDFDRDGLLDLYVTAYVDYRTDLEQQCSGIGGAPNYCGPNSFKPLSDRLYRNLGDGRFQDVTVTAQMHREVGAGLGVVARDFDGDGYLDVAVANDQQANLLWVNRGDGTFSNDASFAGFAVNGRGETEASMGVVAQDLNGDGLEDVFLTHLAQQTNTLLINAGEGLFQDRTASAGLALPSLESTGFGATAIDLQLDGWLDLVVTNGAVVLDEVAARERDFRALGQPDQVLVHRDGRFESVPLRLAFDSNEEIEEPTSTPDFAGRGLARVDLDNDGLLDFVINNNEGPAQIFVNRSEPVGEWVGMRLLRHGRDALGARVMLSVASGRSRSRTAVNDGSYLSAQDPRVTMALPMKVPQATEISVEWLDGTSEFFEVEAGRYQHIVWGAGRVR